MTQLSYTVPTPGNNFSVEAPHVDTALTQILNTVNGNLDSSNINMTTVGAALTAYLPGALLASKLYSPGSLQDYTVAANTWTYPDTTNLAITATMPQSGNVIVRAHGGAIQANGTVQVLAGVSTASSGNPTFSQQIGVATNTTANAAGGGGMSDMPFHVESLLTGLAGSQTFYLGIYVSNTNGDWFVDGASSLAGGPVLITVTGA